MRRAFRSLIAVLLLSTFCLARVDRVDVQRREDVLGGKAWGSVGAYEKLSGRVYFKVRPGDLPNRAIVDLDKADRNPAGEVEFSADFYILRPKETAKGNGTLLLEISNRGGKGILGIANNGRGGADPATEQDFGDGFLMNHGYTVAWVGWQFDAAGDNAVKLYAPIARGPNGEHIRGLVRTDFTLDADREDAMPLGHWIQNRVGGFGYHVADPASEQNVLTVRDTPTSPRMVIPRDQWRFGADNNSFEVNGGFQKGRIYELVYVAQDPVVVGLGFAAIRDFVSYEKHAPQAVAPVKRAIGVGISQSGRFLRHMIYQRFNADEQDRIVFDGMIPHVAGAGRGSFNHRFAQPSRDSQPMNALFYPTDLFPFTGIIETDPLTGEKDGLFGRYGSADATLPKIFFSNTSYEYWGRAASLIHTTPDGKRDITPASNVRIYFYAGLQHYSDQFPPRTTAGQNPNNPNPVRWFWRAAITNMDAWIARDVEPPASVYPKLADGTLVPLDQMRFPYLRSVALPRDANMGFHVDYGPEFRSKGIIANEPPIVGAPFPIFVPKPNADGEDMGGVTLPELSVPLATYTGWNLRSNQTGAPTQRDSFVGSYLPFAKTKAEREASGDPRPSIAERYSSKEQYLDLYRKAAEKLVEQRFLLRDDVPGILQHAAEEWDVATKP